MPPILDVNTPLPKIHAAVPGIEPDVLQEHSALSGAGAELLLCTRKTTRPYSTAEFANLPKRQLEKLSKESEKVERSPAFAN